MVRNREDFIEIGTMQAAGEIFGSSSPDDLAV